MGSTLIQVKQWEDGKLKGHFMHKRDPKIQPHRIILVREQPFKFNNVLIIGFLEIQFND